MPARTEGSHLGSRRVRAALEGLARIAAEAPVVDRSGRLQGAGLAEKRRQGALEGVARIAAEVPVVDSRPAVKGDGLNATAVALARSLGEGEKVSESLHIAKNALNGGEMAPGMGARFDQARFQTGCHYLLNMVPLPTGGITKRPGFEALGQAMADGGGSRLIPFVFSAGESRMLEFYPKEGKIGIKVWTSEGESLGEQAVLPWDSAVIPELGYCQSADVIFLVCAKYPPWKLMRYGDTDWRTAKIIFTPQTAPPRWVGWWRHGNQPESGSFTSLHYVATAVNAETGEESVASDEIVPWDLGPLGQTYYVELEVAAQAGISEFRIYKKSAGVYGYCGRITEATSGRWLFEDHNIAADTEDTPPSARDPFNATGKYPAVVFLHQQRLGFASSTSNPLTVWLSQAGAFESMASSIPPDDDDAIEATLAAPQANRILWAVSERSGLTLGTEGGEWLLTATEGAALSPKDLSFQPQTTHGSQPGLAPLLAGSSPLFVQRGGRCVRDLVYSFESDRYAATDLTLLARHILAANPIQSWAWQPEPYGVAWCALKDGSMAGLTYLREHEVIAWHRHATPGFVHSLTTIPDASGNWQLWAIIDREVGHVIRSHVERLRNFSDSPPASASDAAASHLDGPNQLPFEARAIPCLPDTTINNGTTFLLIKKINQVKIRVLNSAPFHVRVTSQNQPDSPLFQIPAKPQTSLASLADWATPISAGFRDNPQLELVMDGPNPATILGLTITIELADQAGSQG